MRRLASRVALTVALTVPLGGLAAALILAGCQKKAPDAAGQAASSATDPAATRLKSTDSFVSKERVVDPETLPGAALYRQHCASCHEGQVPKAPQKVFLHMLSADSIHRALTSGIMQAQAAALNDQQRREVADYLGAAMGTGGARLQAPLCDAQHARFDASKPPLEWGWGYDNKRFVSGKDAGLDAASAAKLELKWAFEFPNAIRARSQPTIAYGAVYVGSDDGTVYALDLATGCVRWTFAAGAEVRTGIVVVEGSPPRAYFGDLIARTYALDAFTGKLLWSAKVDEHPSATQTGTPTYHDGRLYVPVSSLEVTAAADPKYECCTFRGSIVALDARSGKQFWKAYSIPNAPAETGRTSVGTRVLGPSGSPIWNSPTVDARRGLLYAGTGENYSSPADDTSDALLAIRIKDGTLAWKHQTTAHDAWNVGCMIKDNPNCPKENGPDVDFASGTILAALPGGGDVLLAGQKNGAVYALDPANSGKLLWQTKVGRGGVQGGVHFGMALDGTRLYVPISDLKDGRDGRVYDEPPRPGLYALDASDGRLLWSSPANDVCNGREHCDPGISAAISATSDVVFAGHMDGRLRAYDSRTGKVVWEFDTAREFKAVSGGTARGGSFGGPGPAIRDGYVVANSGYGMYFHMPGNALLVFGPKN